MILLNEVNGVFRKAFSALSNHYERSPIQEIQQLLTGPQVSEAFGSVWLTPASSAVWLVGDEVFARRPDQHVFKMARTTVTWNEYQILVTIVQNAGLQDEFRNSPADKPKREAHGFVTQRETYSLHSDDRHQDDVRSTF